jgi:hypothetical protein
MESGDNSLRSPATAIPRIEKKRGYCASYKNSWAARTENSEQSHCLPSGDVQCSQGWPERISSQNCPRCRNRATHDEAAQSERQALIDDRRHKRTPTACGELRIAQAMNAPLARLRLEILNGQTKRHRAPVLSRIS